MHQISQCLPMEHYDSLDRIGLQLGNHAVFLGGSLCFRYFHGLPTGRKSFLNWKTVLAWKARVSQCNHGWKLLNCKTKELGQESLGVCPCLPWVCVQWTWLCCRLRTWFYLALSTRVLWCGMLREVQKTQKGSVQDTSRYILFVLAFQSFGSRYLWQKALVFMLRTQLIAACCMRYPGTVCIGSSAAKQTYNRL